MYHSHNIVKATLFIFIGILIGVGVTQTIKPKDKVKEAIPTIVKSKSVCEEILKREKIEPVQVFDGTPAKVNFASYPEAKFFRTRITEDAAKGPNFAGHYTFVEWGCGTDCHGYAIVDAINGNIVDYNDGGILDLAPYYYPNSRLLIYNSKADAKRFESKNLDQILTEDPYYASRGRDYYELVEESDGTAWLNRICSENYIDGLYNY